MAARGPRVTFPAVQDRRKRGTDRPWIVRWTVAGKSFSESHRTRSAADRARSALMVSYDEGLPFDPRSGRPLAWSRSETTVASWLVEWFRCESDSLAPKTRKSYVEALERALPLAVVSDAAPAPGGHPGDPLRAVRRAAKAWLLEREVEQPAAQEWLHTWALPLADLDADAAARIHAGLGRRLDGASAANNTAKRWRGPVHTAITAAVRAGHLDSDPWPSEPKGRSRRKSSRKLQRVDIRALPTSAQASAAIEAVVHPQHRLILAVMADTGMRPSEVLGLRASDISALDDDWGVLYHRLAATDAGEGFTKVDIDAGVDERYDIGKTGDREVTCSRQLVDQLLGWVDQHGYRGEDLLFPKVSNLNRSWRRACSGPWRPYDLRHMYASETIAAGAPLTDVADQLGHSVETLLRCYAQAVPAGRERFLAALMESRRSN